MHYLFFWICSLSCIFAFATPLIPRDVLFGNPSKTQVRISPNSKYISYLTPEHGALNLCLASKDDLNASKVITQDHHRGISQYFWTYDSKYILYMQDFNGDENFRLYRYDVEKGTHQLMTPEKGVKTSILGLSNTDPNHIIIGLNERNPAYFDAYKLDLSNGELTLVLENNQFSEIIVDNNLDVRLGAFLNDSGDEEVLIYKNGSFEPFRKIKMEDTSGSQFLGFTANNQTLYFLSAENSNTNKLLALDLTTGKETSLAQDPKSDLSIFLTDINTKKIQAITSEYETPKILVLDSSVEKSIRFLENKLKHFSITSKSLDGEFWLVAGLSDTAPISYYLYTTTTQQLEFLFSSNPELAKYVLRPMQPIVIESRDHLNLVCYLTLPANSTKNTKPLPTILYVHGGPWARDYFGYNPVHQWLANRGYAVLSVNYRGSTGFGKEFVNAGNLQWADKMHEDLLDCVEYLINQKTADPKKIGIMGGSYGGYATLVGLSMTPEVFALGVDIVGPSNLLTLCKSLPPYWKPLIADMKQRIGDWENPEGIETLKKKSPLFYVDKIQKPLLIAQGAFDPRVKQAESDQMVKAMQKKKIPVIYTLYPEEGHGFAKAANRESFYAITELFLGSILGGEIEPIGKDFTNANFILNGEKNPTPKEAEAILKTNLR